MSENKEADFLREIMRLKLEKFIFLDLNMEFSPCIKGSVAIYGAGILGKLLFRSFEEKPVAFIDQKQGLNDICGIPVYGIDDCSKELLNQIDTIVITPIWAAEEIEKNIKKICDTVNIVSLERLVGKL